MMSSRSYTFTGHMHVTVQMSQDIKCVTSPFSCIFVYFGPFSLSSHTISPGGRGGHTSGELDSRKQYTDALHLLQLPSHMNIALKPNQKGYCRCYDYG